MRGSVLLTALLIAAVVCPAGVVMAEGPSLTPDQVAELLASLHPDYRDYIGGVRYGATRLRPASLYAGLVKHGGRDPADPEDGPLAGRGVRNDLIIYADTFEPWRSHAWRLLLADHEYFHAIHLAHAAGTPVVGFGQPRADADYYEALAWGYTLRRATEGVYGELTPKEKAEATRRYEERYASFHRFVMDRQPSAWAHYGRFLPAPDALEALLVRTAASAPTGAREPEAGPGTW